MDGGIIRNRRVRKHILGCVVYNLYIQCNLHTAGRLLRSVSFNEKPNFSFDIDSATLMTRFSKFTANEQNLDDINKVL